MDRQIREAQERGDFDNLPGKGKPIPGRGQPDDELWWLKQYMAREQLTFALPRSLQIRKEAEDIQTRVGRERRESEVRRIVGELNDRIRAETRTPTAGPPLRIGPLDVDTIVEAWRLR